MSHVFFAKDFIQTYEGLVFAVVEQGLEKGKVLCFLRYVPYEKSWRKLATADANQFLKTHYPQYLYFSEEKSAHLHAVDIHSIAIHHQPKRRLQAILAKNQPDVIEQDCVELCQLFLAEGIQLQDLGVTGSLLIGVQNADSDIDLIVYGRNKFHQLRGRIEKFIKQKKLQQLDEQSWAESYQRRQCDLTYVEYVWHEQRKYNKALINNRKFDLNLIELASEEVPVSYIKQGVTKIRAIVLDAQYSFDYPAKFFIDHDEISEVVCYTATYTGQAVVGESIDVSGQLEVSNTGQARILVGSTREATGEYIRVVPPA